MAFYTPPSRQQGLYRYTPKYLKRGGPSRLFPAVGEDGTLRFLMRELRQALIKRGQLSEPVSLMLQQVDTTLTKLDDQWNVLGTLLVDWQIFQSPWLNFALPPGEQFDVVYISDRKKMAQVLVAARKAARGEHPDELTETLTKLFAPVPARPPAPPNLAAFYRTLEQQGRHRPRVMAVHERDGGLSDREFARQRLAGTNPMILHRVRGAEQEILQPWATQPSYLLATGETIHLTEAAAQNRLFLAEYPLLSALTQTDLQAGRYVGSPRALFFRSEQGLYPVLVQLEPGGKVFTPDGQTDDWVRAKLYTQIADVTHHELIDHLCHTHLSMEAFAIATPRQLPPTHPLSQLLLPHFKFLLAINNRGNKILLAEGAAIDSLLAPLGSVAMELMNRAFRNRTFQDYGLPNNIQQRGLEAEFLPEFAYRDDASLLWQAIEDYAAAFLKRYYPTDQAVQQDPYLQAWAAELGAPLNTRPLNEFPTLPAWVPSDLAAQVGLALTTEDLPNHPRIPGFPTPEAPGTITSLQQLIAIATRIIFICGPQHAAVNFSQFDYIGYTANAPMAAYVRPETSATLDQFLPSEEQKLKQTELTFALSGIIWSRLGNEKFIRFSHESDRQILRAFQHRLADIETEIQTRNQQRLQKDGIDYPYLLPSQIPNSINI
ncbi:MAG: lipoxygenase [Scytolyngbya sp. HA4215-MV1]|jgi:arachidonate 15-lipoxygenase|nr:lipoxygenase [Scytolyngbya sp. HA4215-MV1]